MRKFFQNFIFLTCVIGIIFTVQAFAQVDGNPANWCRNGLFPQLSEFKLAKITGKKGDKVFFYNDFEEDCPVNISCRSKAYVIPNDEIIVGNKLGDFSCVWFQPAKGSETVGWIPTDKLQIISENSNTKLLSWVGKWKCYGDSINIFNDKKSGFLTVKGEAFWQGLGDNVHEGELDEVVKPFGNMLKLGENDTEDYDCKVSMQLIGKYLIVADNNHCGGMNVTFTGIYQRKISR